MGLDAVELVMEVEQEFDISISNEDVESLYTVQDLAMLALKLSAGTPNRYAAVLQRVRELTAAHAAMPVERVLPESRFVEDLDMG